MSLIPTPSEQSKMFTLLHEAMNEGLEIEVIYTALKLMREDDSLTPIQAFQEAVDEWIK